MPEKLFEEKTDESLGGNTEPASPPGSVKRGKSSRAVKKKQSGKPSFEESYKRLQSIVQEIEREDIELETLLTKFEEGISLIKDCFQFLQSAKIRIEQYVEERNGTFSIKGLTNIEENS